MAEARPPGAVTQWVTAAPGVILAQVSLRPVYANDEAVRVLAYPSDPRSVAAPDGLLADRLRGLLGREHTAPPQSPLIATFLSGRRRYMCRAFALHSQPANNSSSLDAAIAVLIERRGQVPVNTTQLAGRFHLTPREQETLLFLMQGLTNKEIGNRMKISPNTVKAFLKLVMVKMDVSTRSGIVGKILEVQS